MTDHQSRSPEISTQSNNRIGKYFRDDEDSLIDKV